MDEAISLADGPVFPESSHRRQSVELNFEFFAGKWRNTESPLSIEIIAVVFL
jgi:hypothetical protein